MIALRLVLLAAAAAPAVARVEVPVRAVVLSDGTRRYGVPLTIGVTAVEAGLDTGSTGLRVLPGVLAADDATPTSHSDSYSYGAGAKLDGVTARATVAAGSQSGPITIQQVKTVGCTAAKPDCAADRVALADYGIQGNGLRGEGFKAILGVNMAKADVASVFAGIGATRWLIDLPRPGEPSGRIVLDPGDDEVAGFVALPVVARYSGAHGGLHDAVAGCLVNGTTKAKICGAVLFDTGAPGIRVETPGGGKAWPDGTPVSLVLADGSGRVKAVEQMTIGLKAHASRLAFARGSDPVPVIYAGLAPYFAFSVLYDPAHGTVAVKPRAPAPDGPTGVLP